MDRNQQAAVYLQQLAPGRIAGVENMAFRSQLQRIRFDHSPASLAQVDAMLAAVRASMKLDCGSFLEKQPAVNFVVALNFYLGATIARLGNFAIKWLDHAQAARHMPGLPAQLETDTGCVIGDALVFPASVVLEALFAPEVERTCRGFADRMVEQLTANGQRLPDPLPRPQGEPGVALPAGLRDALAGAGFLGAMGLGTLADGAPLGPKLLVPAADAQRMVIDFSTFAESTLDALVDQGLQRLQANADGLPWQAMHYDGFVNLPMGRRDALIVELRVYGRGPDASAAAPPETVLALTMALPYRPAGDPQGFANYAPRMVSCSYQGPELAGMLDAFYRGACSDALFDWDARYAGE